MKIRFLIYLITISLLLSATKLNAQIQIKADTTQIKAQINKSNVMLVPESSLQMVNSNLYKLIQLQWVEKPTLYYWNEANRVYLWWTPVKDAIGFNIYRKKEGGSYQKIASELKWPVDQNTACNQLQNLLPISSSSLEYQHMQNVLRATVPGLFKNKEWFTCPPLVDKSAKQAVYDLSRLYHELALIIGYGYFDENVTLGETYYYKVKYLDESNQEHDFAEEIDVEAGSVITLTKPEGLILTPGDGFIRLHWADPNAEETVIGYNIYRSESMTGTYKRINVEPALVKDTIGLSASSKEMFGFIDTLTQNYTKYFYKIAARSPTGKESANSDVASAYSTDMTPPKIPGDFTVNHTNKDTVLIQWSFVDRDIKGNIDIVAGYSIYRYDTYDTAINDTIESKVHLIKYIEEHRSKPGIYFMYDVDRSFTDGGLTPERAYWYRISCIDTAGNTGRKSVALSVIVPDIESPDPPYGLSAESGLDYIKIDWFPPDTTKKKNKDLAGYLVYRGICGDSFKVKTYRDNFRFEYYPLSLLKDITDIDSLSYIDRSIPKGSPICYRYSVKAYDKSQNLSRFSDSTCERLHDCIPPDKPVIISLEARNKLIKLEAVAPPIQDIGGFIVERLDSSKMIWSRIFPDSVQPQPVDCESIPVEIDSIKSKKVNYLSFTDTNVNANAVYWYRVKCYDLNGNISNASSSISTITYDITNYKTPVPLSAKFIDDAVLIKWNNNINETKSDFLGYVVFRSLESNSDFRQVSAPLKTPEFNDASIAFGVTYWYKIQVFRSNGDRSDISAPIKISIPE